MSANTSSKLSDSLTNDGSSTDTITLNAAKQNVQAVQVFNDNGASVVLRVWVDGVHNPDDTTEAAYIAAGKSQVFAVECGRINQMKISAAASCAYRYNTMKTKGLIS